MKLVTPKDSEEFTKTISEIFFKIEKTCEKIDF